MEAHLTNRHTLRQWARQRRRGLTPQQQKQAGQQAAERAMQFPPLQQAKNIALFLSFDGELDSQPLIDQLWQRQQQVCLPILHPFARGQLLFMRYDNTTPLVKNHLGISEPSLDIRQVVPVSELDVVMVPLVAFDGAGRRLGMGGGFYDRTLQHWQRHHLLPAGFAHDCQQVDLLPQEAWDIPLPALITPSALWQWPEHLAGRRQPQWDRQHTLNSASDKKGAR